MSDPGFQALSDEAVAKTLSIKDVYDIFAFQINKEDQLVISRMSWGLTSNGAVITLFGGLYAFLNSTYADIGVSGRSVILLLALVVLFAISFSIYMNTIEAIWVARRQIYSIRRTYHEHWGRTIEALHLPRPYGDRSPVGGAAYAEPVLVSFPIIVLPPWVPYGDRLHDRSMGPIRFIHEPSHSGPMQGKRWFAERILLAGLSTWGAIFLLILAGMISEGVDPQPRAKLKDASLITFSAPDGQR